MNATRNELIAVIVELCTAKPELRFGQMIINLTHLVRAAKQDSVWDIEDHELLTAARRLLDIYRSHERNVA